VQACCVSQGIIKILFKRDWRFWYYFVPNLSEYTCAKSNQNRSWFDKVNAKISWCSFFDSQCRYHYMVRWQAYVNIFNPSVWLTSVTDRQMDEWTDGQTFWQQTLRLTMLRGQKLSAALNQGIFVQLSLSGTMHGYKVTISTWWYYDSNGQSYTYWTVCWHSQLSGTTTTRQPFQPGTQLLSPAETRQLTSPASPAQSDSLPAWQPAAFKPGIAGSLSARPTDL